MSYGWGTTGYRSGERVAEQRVGQVAVLSAVLGRTARVFGRRNAVVGGLPGDVNGFDHALIGVSTVDLMQCSPYNSLLTYEI
jgi:hypothetical protein